MNKAEQIWSEYSRLMFSIACGFFGDTPDAEDAVHEAFLYIAKNQGKISDNDLCKLRNIYAG